MAQIKKEEVREAILAAAARHFAAHGYTASSMPAIAREAGISTANIYVYFKSKIELLYTLYEPWLMQRLDELGSELTRLSAPRLQVRRLLEVLWQELPRASNGFANNVMQALSTISRGEEYNPHLRQRFQSRVADWLSDCLVLSRREADRLAAVLLMALDGYAMNVHVGKGLTCDDATIQLTTSLICGRV